MSNTPSRAEIEALVKRHGATSYRNRADTQNPAFGFSVAGLENLLAEVRKQDDALIGQMLEVLEYVRNTPDAEYDSKAALSKAQAAITAAIARLSERRNAS